MQPDTTPPAQASQPTEDAPAAAPAQPLSKNAQKRLAKAALIAEHKKERRAAEKERRKEKKRILAEKRAAGELDEDEDEDARASKKRRTGAGPKRPFKARVVVDLGFDDKMQDNEVRSLVSQLAYTYSANRKAEQPFEHLLFTSLNGRTFTRMEGMSNAAYKRWVNAEWWTEGYERLWEQSEAANGESLSNEQASTISEGEGTQKGAGQVNDQKETVEGEDAPAAIGAAESKAEQARRTRGDRDRQKASSTAPKESVVYLTADSQDELTELKEGETYIIGGICDHNRYKNLCFDKAESSGIRSARLPIGTYLASLKTRKVLTVNQTFEILLNWVETRDWEQALEAVIPKRKFNNEGRKRGGQAGREGDAAEDGGGDEDEIVVDAAEMEEAEQADMLGAAGNEQAERTTEIA
ncbi:guanine-1-methyltransferase-domain-containing protein [Rhodofomes roseus]|uniref:tRNA (guanine(9)-N1)-methyltransferase n=1 Tax=Rhodofomes roseus TaxID=34475 RepID=A0ABQ8K8Z4_9APHY|nr:guanine-1-methyltransferase-domain-containing protein [Rhodofomes roseus]KAH9833792.1 guanine-1-methyltransferase-domain-containing protein [Rhodofomes roseus]